MTEQCTILLECSEILDHQFDGVMSDFSKAMRFEQHRLSVIPLCTVSVRIWLGRQLLLCVVCACPTLRWPVVYFLR